SFVLGGLRAFSYRLELLEPGAEDGEPHVTKDHAAPGMDEVVLVVPRVQPDPGRVRGGFVDAGARLRAGELVFATLETPDRMILTQACVVEGRFAFDRIAPGSYRVLLGNPGRFVQQSAWFDLAPDADVDVGELRSVRSGAVRVELVAPDGGALR